MKLKAKTRTEVIDGTLTRKDPLVYQKGETIELNLDDFTIVDCWRDVVGFEGLYEVSNEGRVKTVERKVKNKHGVRTVNPIILKQSLRLGYPSVTLSSENKNYSRHVHRLVAQAFLPNPDDLPQINHKDLNPENNNVDNLEWCTAKHNINHYLDNKPTTPKPIEKLDEGECYGGHGDFHNAMWEKINEIIDAFNREK